MNINNDYNVRLLREFIGILSANPPGNERTLAEFIAESMKRIGIDSKVDLITETRANVVGFLKGKRRNPLFVLNGHLDTVPVEGEWTFPPFSGVVKDGKLYGLGAADMKGGISSMITAVKALIDSGEKLNGSLMLSFVADEERRNIGTINFLDRYNKEKEIDYAVIGEPTNLRIVTSHRGVMRFKIVAHGRAAHSGNPSKGVNAIYMMSNVIDELKRLSEILERRNPCNGIAPSLAITLIKGGTAENIIPDRCEITVDRRTTWNETQKGVEEEITSILKNLEKKEKEVIFSFEKITAINAWRVPESSKLLKHAEKAYKKCFGIIPEMQDLGATCEAVLFSDRGIDTIVFGPGNIINAHTKNEYVEIDQLSMASSYYNSLIREVIGG